MVCKTQTSTLTQLCPSNPQQQQRHSVKFPTCCLFVHKGLDTVTNPNTFSSMTRLIMQKSIVSQLYPVQQLNSIGDFKAVTKSMCFFEQSQVSNISFIIQSCFKIAFRQIVSPMYIIQYV